MFIDFRERMGGDRSEGGRETRQTDIAQLPSALGIEPATFWCTG